MARNSPSVALRRITSSPSCLKKAASPSRRSYGPEKSRSTVRELAADARRRTAASSPPLIEDGAIVGPRR
eukprot:4657388-Prymnesium_polylepis.1